MQLVLLASVSQRVQVLMMDVKVPCLLSLLTNLNLCFGLYGSTIIDDLERVPQLKQNFPNDYVIPVGFISNDVAGACWMTLNLYPLEESLVRLSNMFGEKSTNRESLLIFIIMLQSVRVKTDHMKLEMMMHDFDCHFQEQRLLSGPYFDYVENFLRSADREIFDLSCMAPPCPSTPSTPTTTEGTSQSPQCHTIHQSPEVQEVDNSRKRTPLFFVVILFTTCVAVLVLLVRSRRRSQLCSTEDIQIQPTDTSQTAPASLKHD